MKKHLQTFTLFLENAIINIYIILFTFIANNPRLQIEYKKARNW